jgi:hypothetical protein
MLNPHAIHYVPPETNHQTQIRKNTNHQLNPMAAEYNHSEPHHHATSQNQKEKTNLEELTWEGVEPQDKPETEWEETEQEDTPPSSPKNTEEENASFRRKTTAE